MGIINQTLQHYVDAIDAGFVLIGGDVRWVFNTLVVINIAVAAMFWAFSEDQVLVPLLRKIIHIGIFAWLIENWVELTNTLASTFTLLGAKAGGNLVSPDIMLNPGQIADRGIDTAIPLLRAAGELSGPIGLYANLIQILILIVASFVVLLSFYLIAIQLVMAIITFKIGTLVVFVLLPFSLIKQTAFIAERPLGWVVSAGVRLMLLTLVVGLGENMFDLLRLGTNTVRLRASLEIALSALLFLALTLTASRLASELASGTPRLGAFDAGMAVAGAGLATNHVIRKSLSIARAVNGGSKLGAVKAASNVGGAGPSSSGTGK